MLPRRIRCPLATVVVTLLAFGATAAADPIDDARRKRDEAQGAAVVAAQRYVDALAEQARQEAEIARLEREIPALKARAEELRREVVDLNRDLFMLEEDLLFPASTQVAVFVSMDTGTFFALDSVQIKVDDKEVANYWREHYDLSMQIGEMRLFPAVRASPDGGLIAATGVSCRQQIAHGTGRKADHPVVLLHRALVGP